MASRPSRQSVRWVVLWGLLVVVMLSPVTVFAAVHRAVAAPDTYAVTQGGECWNVAPVGDGTETVASFYDYRAGAGTRYSSYGTTDLQRSGVSQLFVYRGSGGDSLVVLHDRINDTSDGGAVTFTFSGLPAGGEWAVMDDHYPHQDDRFDRSETSATVDWMWYPNRTDGGAYRGIGSPDYDRITIDPAFSEESWAYTDRSPRWPHASDPISWYVRDGRGTLHALDESKSVSIAPGRCGGSAPDAALSAPSSVEAGESATLDASDSTATGGVEAYRWDVDGDGAVETTTDSPTLSHTYDRTGQYSPAVTVVDASGRTDTASVELSVSDTTPPSAVADVPGTAAANESFTASANGSTDNGRIASYEWQFGDGATATGATATHAYESAGTYTVTLTVTDAAGNAATADRTVSVRAGGDVTPPTAALDAPSRTEVGQSATLDASASRDDRGIASYQWDLDGDGAAETTTDAATLSHTYASRGRRAVAVTVVDAAGNADTATATVNVTDTTPPSAAAAVPESVAAGESFTVSANGSTDNGRIASYEWQFGDGATATGATATHAYESAGTHTVTLTVTDAAGNEGTASRTVAVGSSGGGAGDGGEAGDGDTSGGDDSGGSDAGSSGGGSDAGNSAGSGNGGGGGGGGGGSTVAHPHTSVRPTDAGVVLVTEHARAGRPITEAVAGDAAPVGPVRIERVSYRPGASAERLALEASVSKRVDGDPPTAADGVLGYVSVSRRRPDDVAVKRLRLTLGVRAGRLDELNVTPSAVTLYYADDGGWEPLETRVVSRRGTWTSLSASPPAPGRVAVGVRRPVAAASELSLRESRVPVSEPVELAATVRNSGHAGGDVRATLTRDGTPVANRTVELAPGESRTVRFTARFDSTGTHTLGVAGARRNVTVVQPGAAFEVVEVTANETTVPPDHRVEIRAVVENTGGESGTYDATLSLFGDVDEVRRVTVPPGERRTVTFSRRLTSPGEYTASVGGESATVRVTESRGRDSTTESRERGTDTGSPGHGTTAVLPETNGHLPEFAVAFLAVTLFGLGGASRLRSRR